MILYPNHANSTSSRQPNHRSATRDSRFSKSCAVSSAVITDRLEFALKDRPRSPTAGNDRRHSHQVVVLRTDQDIVGLVTPD